MRILLRQVDAYSFRYTSTQQARSLENKTGGIDLSKPDDSLKLDESEFKLLNSMERKNFIRDILKSNPGEIQKMLSGSDESFRQAVVSTLLELLASSSSSEEGGLSDRRMVENLLKDSNLIDGFVSNISLDNQDNKDNLAKYIKFTGSNFSSLENFPLITNLIYKKPGEMLSILETIATNPGLNLFGTTTTQVKNILKNFGDNQDATRLLDILEENAGDFRKYNTSQDSTGRIDTDDLIKMDTNTFTDFVEGWIENYGQIPANSIYANVKAKDIFTQEKIKNLSPGQLNNITDAIVKYAKNNPDKISELVNALYEGIKGTDEETRVFGNINNRLENIIFRNDNNRNAVNAVSSVNITIDDTTGSTLPFGNIIAGASKVLASTPSATEISQAPSALGSSDSPAVSTTISANMDKTIFELDWTKTYSDNAAEFQNDFKTAINTSGKFNEKSIQEAFTAISNLDSMNKPIDINSSEIQALKKIFSDVLGCGDTLNDNVLFNELTAYFGALLQEGGESFYGKTFMEVFCNVLTREIPYINVKSTSFSCLAKGSTPESFNAIRQLPDFTPTDMPDSNQQRYLRILFGDNYNWDDARKRINNNPYLKAIAYAIIQESTIGSDGKFKVTVGERSYEMSMLDDTGKELLFKSFQEMVEHYSKIYKDGGVAMFSIYGNSVENSGRPGGATIGDDNTSYQKVPEEVDYQALP